MENYSNFCTFEIASLVNVPGYYFQGNTVCQNVKNPFTKLNPACIFKSQISTGTGG